MTHISKRTFFSSLALMTAVPNLAWANPDAGGDGGDKFDLFSIPGTRLPNGSNLVRQKTLENLSYEQFSWLNYLHIEKRLVVPGFSPAMLSWILRAAVFDHKRLKRLLRRLRGVQDIEQRRAILQEEIVRLEGIIAKLEAVREPLERKLDNGEEWTEREDRVFYESLERTNKLKPYLKTLETWVEVPHEGRLSS